MARKKHYDAAASQWRYGTVAFGFEFMRKTIGFGRPIIGPKKELMGFDERAAPSTLSIAPWIAFVPKEYKDDVLAYARIALERQKGIEIDGKGVLHRIVEDVHFEIWEQLLPLPAGALGGA